MGGGNYSTVTKFVFTGLTDNPDIKILLFITFLHVYIITLVGNIGIILLVRSDPHLHTPMYNLISHLSFIDVCYSTTITPKMLSDLLAKWKLISIQGCLTQLSSFSFFATTECILLAVMAYDRYVAICNPLRYAVIMTKNMCMRLVAGVYVTSFTTSVINIGYTFTLSFCGPNKIKHFFCDFMALFKLSCTDTMVNEILLFAFSLLLTMSAIITIIVSYISILTAVLKIQSVNGRSKVFSTCASHFLCVVIFYGTLFYMYLRPSSSHSKGGEDYVASVFYAVVIPMLNPLIYSLRNKSMKHALRKTICYRNVLIMLEGGHSRA